MWVTFRDLVVNMLISGVYSLILSNAGTIIGFILGGTVVWAVTAAKGLFKFLPGDAETVVDTSLDNIGALVDTAINTAIAQISTLTKNALSDGKITKAEITTIISTTLTNIKTSFSAEMNAKLTAEFGTIENAMEAWVKVKLLSRIEVWFAKVGIKVDLDGSETAVTGASSD
jgi:hypothetical protein